MSVNNTNSSLPDKVNLHYYLYTDRVFLFAITNGICLLAFIANGIVLYLTKKYHQFHSAGMYVRAGYAFVDMLTALFLIIHSNLRLATLEFNEDLEEITCWVASLMGGLFFATVQMTAIIAIERYYYFCEPMKYPRYFTLATITLATFSVLAISEGYMIFTQIFIGRETPSYFNSCRLADQSFHKRIQILVFFVPAMACTAFSIYKIARLIRTLSSPEEATTIMKKAVGHKTLRYFCNLLKGVVAWEAIRSNSYFVLICSS